MGYRTIAKIISLDADGLYAAADEMLFGRGVGLARCECVIRCPRRCPSNATPAHGGIILARFAAPPDTSGHERYHRHRRDRVGIRPALRFRRRRTEMAAGLGRARLLPRGRRADRRQAEILRAGDVSLPQRQDPHGPRAQLHAGRCRRPLQTGTRLFRHAPDGLGRVRPAGRERRPRTRRPSRQMDLREHRQHARRTAAHGPVAGMGAGVRHLPAGVLPPPAEAVPRLPPRRPGGAQGKLGQLGPGRRHRAGERAGDRRQGLALRRAGREEAAQPVVPQHHQIRAGPAGRAGQDGPLAGARPPDAGQLDRPQRRRAAGLHAGRRRRDDRGLHHPPRHAVRHVVPGDRPRASAGRRGRRARPGGRGVRRRMPQPRHLRSDHRDRREARLRHRPAGRPSVHRRRHLSGLDRQFRADGIRHRRDLRLPGARPARPGFRPQIRAGRHAGGAAAGRRPGTASPSATRPMSAPAPSSTPASWTAWTSTPPSARRSNGWSSWASARA